MTCRKSIATLLLTTLFACIASAQPVRQAPDVLGQFNQLKERADPMGFLIQPNFLLSGGQHWQGIARHPDPNQPYLYAVANRVDCTELAVIRMGSNDSKVGGRLRSNRLGPQQSIFTPPAPSDRIVNMIALDDKHAGGMQAAGKYLAIPMGDHCNSNVERIALYDISDAEHPVLDRYLSEQDNQNYVLGSVGIVGLTQLDNGTYFMVTSRSGSELFFYQFSELTLIPSRMKSVTMVGTDWPAGSDLDYSFESLQLVNPLGEDSNPFDSIEPIYMIAMRNQLSAGSGNNIAAVFRMSVESDLDATFTVSRPALQAERVLSTSTADDTAQRNGTFAAASGAWISPSGTLCLYSTEYYVTGLNHSTLFCEFSSRFGDYPGNPIDACSAHVELSTGTNYTGKSLTIDSLDYLRDNYSGLANQDGAGGFANNVSSLTWRLPAGCFVRLYNNADFGGDYLQLSGTGELADLANIGWTTNPSVTCNDKFQSVQFVGNGTPAPIVIAAGSENIATLPPLIFPLPCAMVKFSEGWHPGAAIFDRAVELRSMGGVAVIGGQ